MASGTLKKLIDISDDEAREDLRRLSAPVHLDRRAVGAHRRRQRPTGSRRRRVAQGQTTAERFLLEWRGEADPKHVQALDTYWICTCEHGLNASTFIARIVASTGADCAAALSSAVGALSGPLHGGAPARVLPMLDAAAESGDPEGYVERLIERGERLMGFGHRVYRAEDPRARLLKRTAKELGSPRYEVAEKLERGRTRSAARGSRPTARSRRTSSSGRRSCSTSPRSRRSSRPRCSRARGPPAGRRTSSSRRS